MKNNTMIIGIAGASASGKSLLANTIVNELGSSQVVVLSEDAYYKDLSHLPLAERAAFNFDHPESLDHDLLIKVYRKSSVVLFCRTNWSLSCYVNRTPKCSSIH